MIPLLAPHQFLPPQSGPHLQLEMFVFWDHRSSCPLSNLSMYVLTQILLLLWLCTKSSLLFFHHFNLSFQFLHFSCPVLSVFPQHPFRKPPILNGVKNLPFPCLQQSHEQLENDHTASDWELHKFTSHHLSRPSVLPGNSVLLCWSLLPLSSVSISNPLHSTKNYNACPNLTPWAHFYFFDKNHKQEFSTFLYKSAFLLESVLTYPSSFLL